MTVDVARVQGRRKLEFQSLAEVQAEAERLVGSGRARTLGNWPLSRLLMHLALAVNNSIDGYAWKAPWFVRIFAPLFKGHLLKRGLSAGFKLNKKADAASFPPAESEQAAVEALRAAIGRTQREQMTAAHPAFGRLTHEEWGQLHCRHAELHLSFVRTD